MARLFVLLLLSVFIYGQKIQLTAIPTEMLTYNKKKAGDKKSELIVKWLGSTYQGTTIFFRFSSQPGLVNQTTDNTSSKFQADATYSGGEGSINFMPAKMLENKTAPLEPGLYYCYMQAVGGSNLKSDEFQVIVEAETAPLELGPTDGEIVDNGRLDWEDPDNDSPPYFHVLVSDSPIKLKEDAEGNIKIDSLTVIYQAIVPRSSIGGFVDYGTPDPSENFDNSSTAPLVHDATYYWVVLNNYGNHPAFTSSITPSQVASFVFRNEETKLDPATLSAPANKASFNQSASIEFRWTAVANADPEYELYIYELREQDGNVFSFLIKQVTLNAGGNNTAYVLNNARALLRDATYTWNVVAREGQKVSISNSHTFTYKPPTSALVKLTTQISGGSNLARVSLKIKPKNSSDADFLTFFTDGSGKFERQYSEGSYTVLAIKDGFQDATAEFSVTSTTTVSKIIQLKNNPTYFLGRVSAPLGVTSNPQAKLVKYISDNDSTVSYHQASSSEQTTDSLIFRYLINISPTKTGETYRLATSLAGYEARGSFKRTAIASGEYKEFAYALDPVQNTTNLNVTVKDGKGTPLTRVKTLVEQGNSRQTLYTDNFGQITLIVNQGVNISVSAEKINYTLKEVIRLNPNEDEVDVGVELLRNPFFKGTVTDQNQTPIPEVNVRILSGAGALVKEYVTGSSGSFEFSVSPGDYTILLNNKEYIDKEEQVKLAAGENIQIPFNMVKAAKTLTGKITQKKNTSKLITDAFVRYRLVSSSGFAGEVKTGADGKFSMGIPSEEIEVTISKKGFLDSTRTVLKFEGLTKEENFALFKDSANVNGVIKDKSTNQPLANAIIEVVQSSSKIYSGKTDEQGKFYIILPPKINFQKVRVKLAGYITQDVYADFRLTQEKSLAITETLLEKIPDPITGVVKGFQGAVIPNSMLVLTYDGGSKDTTYTNQAGAFAFPGAVGSHELSASFPNYFSEDTTVQQNNFYTIQLSYNMSTIKGTVLGNTGTGSLIPLPKVKVSFFTVEGKTYSGSVITDASGEYRLNLPPERKYKLKYSKSRYTGVEVTNIDATEGGTEIQPPQVILKQVAIQKISVTPIGYNFEAPKTLSIKSTDSLQFQIIGVDTSGNPIKLDGLNWSFQDYDTTGVGNLISINSKGFIKFSTKFFAHEFKVFIKDDEGGTLKDTIKLNILGKVNPEKETHLRSALGLELKLNQGVVQQTRYLRIRKRLLQSALQTSTIGRVLNHNFRIRLLNNRKFIQEFLPGSTVKLPIDDEAQRASLAVVKWNDEILDWELVENKAKRKKEGEFVPFIGVGRYAFIRLNKPLEISDVEILPNPFTPNSELNFYEMEGLSSLNFDQKFLPILVSGATNIILKLDSEHANKPSLDAKIYNFRGNLIKTLVDDDPVNKGRILLQWDGFNNDRQLASNGRYLLVLKVKDSSGEKTLIKQIVMVKK